MLPSEPPSRANIHEWFEVLQVLHGGELPKDLRALQKVMTELEAIRKDGEEKIQHPNTSPTQRQQDKSGR